MKRNVLAITVMSIFILSACSSKQHDETTPVPGSRDAIAQAKAQQEQEQADKSKSDNAIPDDQYFDMDDGLKCLNLYSRINGSTPYESYAYVIARDQTYAIKDQFKRKDFVNSLKPKIDSLVESDKNGKYFYRIIGGANYNVDLVGPYQEKGPGFPIMAPNFDMWYKDDGNCSIMVDHDSVINKYFDWFVVPDESKAREVESARIDKTLRLKIFYTVDKTNYNDSNTDAIPSASVISSIVKFELVNDKGEVLATPKPIRPPYLQ